MACDITLVMEEEKAKMGGRLVMDEEQLFLFDDEPEAFPIENPDPELCTPEEIQHVGYDDAQLGRNK